MLTVFFSEDNAWSLGRTIKFYHGACWELTEIFKTRHNKDVENIFLNLLVFQMPLGKECTKKQKRKSFVSLQ